MNLLLNPWQAYLDLHRWLPRYSKRVNINYTYFSQKHQIRGDKKHIWHDTLREHHRLVLRPFNRGIWIHRINRVECPLFQNWLPGQVNFRSLNFLHNCWNCKFFDHISIHCAKSNVVHSKSRRITHTDEVFARIRWLWQWINVVNFSCRGNQHYLSILLW